jgi:hypothetical protein
MQENNMSQLALTKKLSTEDSSSSPKKSLIDKKRKKSTMQKHVTQLESTHQNNNQNQAFNFNQMMK